MTTGSVVVRRSLGRRLKALRLAAGKTQADVAPVASIAKLKRIEAGQVAQRMADVRTLCFMYHADEVTTEQLVEMTLITENGWWEDYSDLMPSGFRMYVELEAAATSITTWDSELIHGLLQTPAYHRAVFEAEAWPSPDAGERQVQLRAERQRAAFDRTPPLRLYAVIGAGALARQVGSEKVMAEQRQHLLELSRRPHVELYVLPWQAGAHAAMKGAFTVLGFDNPDDPDVVYLETVAGGRYIEQPDMLTRYRQDFDRVRDQSVPFEEYLP
jgi:transcriptional regulator with XRE-family HTH domain